MRTSFSVALEKRKKLMIGIMDLLLDSDMKIRVKEWYLLGDCINGLLSPVYTATGRL
jgi:hypothetical protein